MWLELEIMAMPLPVSGIFYLYLSGALVGWLWCIRVLIAIFLNMETYQFGMILLGPKMRAFLSLIIADLIVDSAMIAAMFWPVFFLMAWKLGQFDPNYVGRWLIKGVR